MTILNNSDVISYAGTIDHCNESIKTCKEIISEIEDHPLCRTKVVTIINRKDNERIEKEISPEITIQLYNSLIDYYKNVINDCNRKLHSLIDKCSKEED